MATIRQVRQRIKVAKNIQQITKAMKMVAAARLKRAQDRGRVTAFGTYQGAHPNFRNSDHSAETSLFAAAGRFSGLWLYKYQLADV